MNRNEDTLTSLGRGVRELELDRHPNAPRAWALAQRIEAFAAREPAWVPEGRVNMLTQLARTIDPHVECDANAALASLRKAASTLDAALAAPLPAVTPREKEGISPRL